MTSTNRLKSRLRGQRRLLAKSPPDQIASLNSAIEETLLEIEARREELRKDEREKKNANKYKMVKFFDRRKLDKMEKKARHLLHDAIAEGDTEAVRGVEERLKSIALDQRYVAYFPNDTKYLSLFAKGEHVEDDGKRRKIRARIEELVKENAIQSKEWAPVETKRRKDEDPVEPSATRGNEEGASNRKKRDAREEKRVRKAESKASSKKRERESSPRDAEPKSIARNPEVAVGGGPKFEEMAVDGAEEVDSEDDFFASADGGTGEIFEGASTRGGEEDMPKGKDKGWATQRQKPGDYKKKRIRTR